MSAKQIIDIHVHSTLKPYGKSFRKSSNIKSVKDSSCVWYEDKADIIDKVDEERLGLSRYRQSDFTSLTQGNHKIACISFYPMEKGFTQLQKAPLQLRRNVLLNFVTMLGRNRLRGIESDDYNYFADYKKEYDFLLALNNQVPKNGNQKYKLLQTIDDVTADANLLIIPTVEGCHFLCEGHDTENPANWSNLKENVAFLKNQPYPLFFVTMAHHFYNGLCTHSKSLYGFIEKALNQRRGMDDFEMPADADLAPISPLGEQLIDLLLSTEKGNRILIDVKHMSQNARLRYYEILASNKYKNQNIPIIYSHGAFAFDEKIQINLNINDVVQIYKSKGIIGIEIDQRILTYHKLDERKGKEAYFDSNSFWLQIKAFAEIAYLGHFDNPWQCIALGSDYDGIINPLDSFRDSSTMGKLFDNLVAHLNDYWNNAPVIPKNYKGTAEEIIHQVMYQNAFDFINEHYLKPRLGEDVIV